MLGHGTIPLGSKSRASQLIKVPLWTHVVKTSSQVWAGPDDMSPLHSEDRMFFCSNKRLQEVSW